MKRITFLLSIIFLMLTILPSFFLYYQRITMETNSLLMLIGTIGWFLTASYWMNKPKEGEHAKIDEV